MQETLEGKPKEVKPLSKYTREEVHKATLEYFNGDEIAADVWINKYCLKDSDGNLYEKTPDDMHWRLANELARIEKKYPNALSAQEIYDKIKNFKKIIPQGSPMSGIGNDFQTVSIGNCFVIGNDADSYGGIFKIDQEQAQLMKRRGGVGTDLSKIRPTNSKVNNSALTSTGVVPFMERYSNTTREVAQSGRRGALMQSIAIKHPDSEQFIDAKLDGTKVTGANISVKIDDEFMEAATNGTTYTQHFPTIIENNKIPSTSKEINASKLWKKIIHNAWDKAEPGILFWDKVLSESIPSCYGKEWEETSTNPCLTLDSQIMTTKGVKYVEDLIGEKFIVYVDGVKYESTDRGFFKTGENKDIYEIKTKKGFKIKSTDNHKFKKITKLERKTKDFDWVELKDFQEGDIINLNNNRGISWDGNGNYEEGWLIGSLLGDGTFNENSGILCYWGDDKKDSIKRAIDFINNNLSHRSDLGDFKNNNKTVERVKSVSLKKLANEYGVDKTKNLNDRIENASSDFYKGFLCGWFDADGTVLDNIEKGINVRLSSSNLNNLYVAQKMLARVGIISSVYENRRIEEYKKLPDGNGSYKNYKTKPQHELVISKDNIEIFQKEINFSENSKVSKLNNAIEKLDRGFYRERFVDIVESITYVGVDDVYDCQIPSINQFDANGISTHNCGELPLPPYDSCRLLVINLYGYVVNPFTDNASFDWDSFKEDVIIAERMMDNVVDLELEKIDKIIEKLINDPEEDNIKNVEITLWRNIKDKAERGRRTGLGITAEGDMLAALGYKYGTDEANEFSIEVHKQLKLEAYRSSVIMAKERGAFPMWNGEKEKNNPFLLRIKDEDRELYDLMMKYGRRNLALLTIAPTGSVSIMTQTSSGIECVFLIYYTRRRKINPNDKNVRVDFTDEVGDTWMEYRVFHHKFEDFLKANGYDPQDVKDNYTNEQIDELIKISPYYGATSNDVDWVKKVEMQGGIQQHVDHSISVTVNLPNDISEEMVGKVYEMGWKSGCKGITVYRDGSRSGVLVTEKEKKEKEKKKLFEDNHAPKRPKRLNGVIVRFQNNHEKWIGVVGMYEGRPYEIFTGLHENGLSDLPASLTECEIVKNRDEDGKKRYDIEYVDSTGEKYIHTGLNHTFNSEYWNYAKMISSVLRHGMPLPYVLDLIQSLNLNDEHLNTWKNGVARVVKRFIKDGVKGSGTCPECGSDNLEFVEGCLTCKSCGNSKCG